MLILSSTVAIGAVTSVTSSIPDILGRKDVTKAPVNNYNTAQTNAKIALINDDVKNAIDQIKNGKKKVADAINTASGSSYTNSNTFTELAAGITAACTAKYNAGKEDATVNIVTSKLEFCLADTYTKEVIYSNDGNGNWSDAIVETGDFNKFAQLMTDFELNGYQFEVVSTNPNGRNFYNHNKFQIMKVYCRVKGSSGVFHNSFDSNIKDITICHYGSWGEFGISYTEGDTRTGTEDWGRPYESNGVALSSERPSNASSTYGTIIPKNVFNSRVKNYFYCSAGNTDYYFLSYGNDGYFYIVGWGTFYSLNYKPDMNNQYANESYLTGIFYLNN